MPVHDSPLVVPARFCGPSASGNGGYTAGLLAERFANHPGHPGGCSVVEVTLRRPPPLDTDLAVEHVDGTVTRALHDDMVVAEAGCADAEPPVLEALSVATATDAMARFAGFRRHPFPGCFVCGPDRPEGDGLRVLPGPVGDGRVASTWVPDSSLAFASDLLDPGVETVSTPIAWAALDCVGGWASDLEGRPMVLGRISARVDAAPVVGETHVVVGKELGRQARKTLTASTMFDADGRVVAAAQHVWIEVDPHAFA